MMVTRHTPAACRRRVTTCRSSNSSVGDDSSSCHTTPLLSQTTKTKKKTSMLVAGYPEDDNTDDNDNGDPSGMMDLESGISTGVVSCDDHMIQTTNSTSTTPTGSNNSHDALFLPPVLPMGLWWMLGVHVASTLVVVAILYLSYQASLISCLGFAAILLLPGTCLFVAARNAHLTLHEALLEEGRGRAILDTLYPQTVLKQMYQQVSVEQIALISSSSSSLNDDDDDDDSDSDDDTSENGDGHDDDESDIDATNLEYNQDDAMLQSPNHTNTIQASAILGYSDEDGTNQERCSSSLLQPALNVPRRRASATIHTGSGPPTTPTRGTARKNSKQGRRRTSLSNTLCHSLSQEMSFLRRNSLTNARRNSLTTNTATTTRRNSLTSCHSNNSPPVLLRRNSLTMRRNSLTNNNGRFHGLSKSHSATSSRRRSMSNNSVHRRRRRRSPSNSSQNSSHRSTPTTQSVSNNQNRSLHRRSSCSVVVGLLQQEPIQEHFAAVTILFADIAGFTKWSSQRTPQQVFQLLERIFLAFDTLGKDMGVYKIETIGDCYLAVTGIPTYMEDHALVMATFAHECVLEFARICRDELQHTSLGADTATLALRAGLHSGPCTAGVLRGEKSRFQLFGDSVNTAARMESNGQPGRVHLSQATADLISQQHPEWLTARPDLVEAKGKGKMQTYWLTIAPPPLQEEEDADLTETSLTAPSIWSGLSDTIANLKTSPSEMETAVVEILAQGLKRIRAAADNSTPQPQDVVFYEPDESALDEAKQIEERLLGLPLLLPSSSRPYQEWRHQVEAVELSPQVMAELSQFVQGLCELFLNKNPYHCLEHAFLQLISINRILEEVVLNTTMESSVHAQLSNDPLAQWALLLAAFCGDIDHPGVSNTSLIQTEPEMAAYFQNHCLTEQNALDTVWELLVDGKYSNKHFVHSLCPNGEPELERFQLLLVHAILSSNVELEEDVMAADQDDRWARLVEACQASSKTLDANDATLATLVSVEQLMQTSSLIPSVQSWDFFVKWSERALRESYLAYISGKEAEDPCTFWYDAVRESLERSTVPLARRLHTRAVYGDAYEEFDKRAFRNLRQWEAQGPSIVSEIVTAVKYQYGEKKG